jgi:hypothetical protein
VVGWTLPLLSSADRVEGVVVALGGPQPRTLWLPSNATAQRWQELLDALAPPTNAPPAGAAAPLDDAAVTPDTVTPDTVTPDMGTAPVLPVLPLGPLPGAPARVDARGRLRVVPAGGALLYARPEYRIVATGAPALSRVVALAGDTVRVGATTIAALSVGAASAVPADDLTDDLTDEPGRLARARRLFLDSRAALRRGDWTAVGRALDALGAALGAPVGASGAAGNTP